MSFDDSDELPWILGPSDEWEQELPAEIQEEITEFNEEHGGDTDEPVEIEAIEEAEELGEEAEVEDIPSIEVIESDYLAPDNEIDPEWELAHHYDFYDDALNYVEGVAAGVLYIVVNDDGSADVYRDPDYGQGDAVAA